jgi:hypothetical protein
MRVKRARSRRRRPGCISTSDCSRPIAREGRRNRPCHLARRRRHLPAGAGGRSRAASHAYRALCACRKPRSDAIAATRARGGRIVAVGTTSLRVLESAALEGRTESRRRRDGAVRHARLRVQVVDLLITNFHLPKSTLLMLVSASAAWTSPRRLPPRDRRSAIASSATAMPCCCTDGHRNELRTARHRRRRPARHADAGPRRRRRRRCSCRWAPTARSRPWRRTNWSASARRSCSATPSTSGCGRGWR